MYTCKFSDLFRSQLCKWLVQLTVLCSFTLIFLLHVLHSVKCSLSTHHIFHHQVCWAIITNKTFLLIFAKFFLFGSLNTLNHSVLISTHLVVHFWSVSCCCCFHLVARKEKYIWRGGDAIKSLQGSCTKTLCKKTLQKAHGKDTSRKKFCIYYLHKHHSFEEVWAWRSCMVLSQVVALK